MKSPSLPSSLVIFIAAIIIILPIVQGAEGQPLPVVPAQEILDKISRGEPVVYRNVIIHGDLNISDLDLPTIPINRSEYEIEGLGLAERLKVVRSSIDLRSSIIQGSLNLSNALILQPIICNKTAICGEVIFKGAQFNQGTDFWEARFNQTAVFSETQFNHDAGFEKVQFSQNANFERVRFNQTAKFWLARFNQRADFSSAQFNQDSDFIGAKFNQTAYFGESEFSQNADFSQAQFNQDADFENVRFNKEAYFGLAKFNQTADFRGIFNQIAYFYKAEFNQSSYFDKAEFNQTANFREAKLHWKADFNEARFNRTATFRKAQFNHTADFKRAIFNNTADFRDANFKNMADFRAKFNQNADFNETRFNQTANFEGAEFNQIADFSGARFNRSAQFKAVQFKEDIIFTRSTFDSADFNQSKFSGDAFFDGASIGILNLTRAEFGKIFIRYSSIGHLAYDETAYLLLMGNFKNFNFLEDANQCYYDYRNDRRATLPLYLQPADYALMLLYGYGMKPERPMIWSLVFIAVFAGLFWNLRGILPRRDGELEQEATDFSLPEAMAFSAMTFLSGGKLVFDPPEYRVAPRRSKREVKISKALFIVERLLGMVLVIMFAIAVGKTIIMGSG